MSKNSLGAKKNLNVGGKDFEIFDISKIEGASNLPFSLKVLLENLLRTEDGANITADHIKALAQWDPSVEPDTEIQFTPARVVMQDFTGVPCVVDLATMREAIVELGGDPAKVNPLAPAELVIDHSVIADVFGTKDSFEQNTDIEYERNRERYRFLRWGQEAFDNFKVVPPRTGIVHQVNLEFLARVEATRVALAQGDLSEVGRLLSASHRSSQHLFENSTPALDQLVDLLEKHPAVLGARLTGGGFGGAVMALTRDSFTEKDAAGIAQLYRAKHGRDPEMIHLQAADGAKALS